MKTKSILSSLLVLAMILVLAVGATSCVLPWLTPELTLDRESAEMIEGDTLQLNATLTNSEETVVWASSDTAKATVSESGLVTAVAEGSVTITASVGEITASCEITISRRLVPTVTLNKTEASMSLYDVLHLSATLTDLEGTVEWTSSDPAKATVNENGMVVARGEGEVTITASVGDVSASCKLTITDDGTVATLALDFSEITLKKGEALDVMVSALWKGEPIDDEITYEWLFDGDADDSVASFVSAGNKVTVTGAEYGSTSITVYATVRGEELTATLDITVASGLSITVSGNGIAPVEGGYSANVSLESAGENDYTSITPTFTVLDSEGNAVENAVISWTVSDESVASFADGKITALKAGTTELVGAYEDLTIKIFVNAYCPEIKLDEKVELETAAPSFTLTSELKGTVQSVWLGDKDITPAEAPESGIGFDASKVALSDLGEGKILKIATDRAVYVFDANVYTMVINDKAEFDAFMHIAREVGGGGTVFNGYFVLGNDIAYNGTYTPALKWAENIAWGDADLAGFIGTFDGRGYNVDGIKIEAWQSGGAIFTGLGGAGVIRNVSFTNAIYIGADAGFLTNYGWGRIENVYIHCTYHDADRLNSGLLTIDNRAAMRIVNCFVDTNMTSGALALGASPVGRVHEGYGILNGVYSVGSTVPFVTLSTDAGEKNVASAYASYTELLAAGIDFSAWEGDFWTVVNGVPAPKNLVASLKNEVTATPEKTDVAKNSTVKFNGLADWQVITLAEPVENVSVSGDVLTIGDVAMGTQIKVNVSNLYGSESKQYVLTVKESQKVVLDAEPGTTFTDGIFTLPTYKVVDDNGAEVADAVVKVSVVDQFGNVLAVNGNKVTLANAGIHSITVKWEIQAEFVVATNAERTVKLTNTNGQMVDINEDGITTLDTVTYDPNAIIKVSEEKYNGAPVIELISQDIWSGNSIQSGFVLPEIDLTSVDFIEFYARTDYVHDASVNANPLRAGTWWGYSTVLTNEWQLIRFPVSAVTDKVNGRAVLWVVMDNNTAALGESVYITGIKAGKYVSTSEVIVSADDAGLAQVGPTEFATTQPRISSDVTYNGAPVFELDYTSLVGAAEVYGGMLTPSIQGKYDYIEFWVKVNKTPGSPIKAGAYWTVVNAGITTEWQKITIMCDGSITWDAEGKMSLWFFGDKSVAEEGILIYVSDIVGYKNATN